MKPYKIFNNQILLKEKGQIVNNTFVRFIGTGDSVFSLFLMSYGGRHNDDLSKRKCEFIIYDKNPKHLEMFKDLLSWDGYINLPSTSDKDFDGFLNVVREAGIKNGVDVTEFLNKKDINSTFGRMTRHLFSDFKQAWDIFRNSQFTFMHIDAINENENFLLFLKMLPSIETNCRQFIKLDFDKSEYSIETYKEAIHNLLHLLWLKSFKSYQTVVELPDDENVGTIEDFAGKLYSKFNSSFCILPWMHIQYKPSGQAKLCCRYDILKERKEFDALTPEETKTNTNLVKLFPIREDADIQTTSLEDSFFGEYWTAARKNTVENLPILACHKCYKEEQVVGEVATSMRLGSSIQYNQGYLHKKPNYDKPTIEFLEVGFGNYCNLACLSCNSTLSTTWHSDELELNKISSPDLKRIVFPKLENLKFTPNAETLKTLKIIKFTGGEPMINPEFVKFIDLICEQGTPENISLEIYTNCSYIPSPKLLTSLTRFKNIQLNLSIDAFGPVNDYIRYGSIWSNSGKQTVSNSMAFWLKQGAEHRNIHIIMSTTLSLLNVFDIPYLVEQWVATFKESGNKIVMHNNELIDYDGFLKLQIAFEPAYISMDILPNEYYNDIVKWCTDYETNFSKMYPEFDFIPESILGSLYKLRAAVRRSNGDVKNAKLFLEYLQNMDKVRGNSAQENIPLVISKVKEFLSKNAN